MNSPEHTDLYDLVIIGAGPAGMTAAVYAEKRPAGFGDQQGHRRTVNWTTLVENYMGFEEIPDHG